MDTSNDEAAIRHRLEPSFAVSGVEGGQRLPLRLDRLPVRGADGFVELDRDLAGSGAPAAGSLGEDTHRLRIERQSDPCQPAVQRSLRRLDTAVTGEAPRGAFPQAVRSYGPGNAGALPLGARHPNGE